jgi:hypothetical protein
MNGGPVTKRAVESAALPAFEILAGMGVYAWSVVMLAWSYTYAVSTAFFLALDIWGVVALASPILLRDKTSRFKRNFVRFLAGMLAFHVVTCLYAAVTMPEAILLWPR